jgi:hypothetical protein
MMPAICIYMTLTKDNNSILFLYQEPGFTRIQNSKGEVFTATNLEAQSRIKVLKKLGWN